MNNRCVVESFKEGFSITERLEWSKDGAETELNRLKDQQIVKSAIADNGSIMLLVRYNHGQSEYTYKLAMLFTDEETGKPNIYTMSLTIPQMQNLMECGKWPFEFY